MVLTALEGSVLALGVGAATMEPAWLAGGGDPPPLPP